MECSELPLSILTALFAMMAAAGVLLTLSIGGMIWQVLIWRKGRHDQPERSPGASQSGSSSA